MKSKRYVGLLILAILILSIGGFLYARTTSDSSTTERQPMESSNTNEPVAASNSLIVYLTRTGNTEAVARMIQEEAGGTLAEIELENSYPEDYQAHVNQVDGENERDYLPPLKTKITDIEQYDTVFIGAPTWDMQLPPPMKSLLNEYDLSGKTVVPFNTNGGFGVGSSFDDVKERCKGCNVLEGFSVEGGRERDGILFVMEGDKEVEVRDSIKSWLQRIGIR